MADFADSTAVALDVELLTPAAAGRLSPALPAGEQLLDANLYAVCDLVAGRAAMAIQEIKARLGHASIETTARYLAELAYDVAGVGDVLDRHHEEQRRRRCA